jgi:hypothetical protein
MPWSGRYYDRSVRVNGRPRRVYVGARLIGQLASQLDDVTREWRAMDRAQVELAETAAGAQGDQCAGGHFWHRWCEGSF